MRMQVCNDLSNISFLFFESIMLSSVENRHSTDGRINNVPSSPFLVATLIIYEDKNALTDLLL